MIARRRSALNSSSAAFSASANSTCENGDVYALDQVLSDQQIYQGMQK